MKTYQDLLERQRDDQLKAFIIGAINDYKTSDTYKWAKEGDA